MLKKRSLGFTNFEIVSVIGGILILIAFISMLRSCARPVGQVYQPQYQQVQPVYQQPVYPPPAYHSGPSVILMPRLDSGSNRTTIINKNYVNKRVYNSSPRRNNSYSNRNSYSNSNSSRRSYNRR